MLTLARLAAALALLPAAAYADGLVIAEVPAALAVSGAQADAFRTGAMPAVGAYVESPRGELGVRLRVGVLGNGPAPGNNERDPGVGGLATAGVAYRLPIGAGWVEGVLGGGITGHDVVPAAEIGAGWEFDIAGVQAGPAVRYLYVDGHDAMGFGSASIVLVGIDVQFGKHRRVSVVTEQHVARIAPPPVEPPPAALEADHEELVDRDTGCMQDGEGCEIAVVDGESLVMHDHRIVLDDRVLFDTDRAKVKSEGYDTIAAIARAWRKHPEWLHVTIEGHADTRGPDDYNMDLSKRRADHVRALFIRDGIAPDQVEAVGYGRTRPRDPEQTEAAHQHNRRVEFAVDQTAPPFGGAAGGGRATAVDQNAPPLGGATAVDQTAATSMGTYLGAAVAAEGAAR